MLEVGQVVAEKYRVERLLGRGGMGAVFEGTHLIIGRRVAIKVLLPEVSASHEGGARFEREVRAAGRIGNEHILDVLDAGSLPDGSRFMVSELLEGETLEKRIERARLTPRECAMLMLDLLDGLAAAHRAGIVHRDLKPDNIFLTRKLNQENFVKIIDFGVSKYQFEDPQELTMTSTGAVIGTPYYLSPEQARGERQLDARSDLYTVGVIMFRCVSGEVPHRADGLRSLLFKIALNPPPPLTRDVPAVDPAFSELVQKAMAREREARFQSAAEMRQALQAFLTNAGASADDPSRLTPGWSGQDTLAAEWPAPTSSNFGRTAPRILPLATGRKRRAWVVAVSGLVLLVIAGIAAALVGRSSAGTATARSSTIPPASTPSALSSASSASEPDVERPDTEPTPPATEPPLEAGSASDAAEATARGHEVPAASLSERHRAPGSAKAARRSLASEPATAPAPRPSSTARQRRDFGY